MVKRKRGPPTRWIPRAQYFAAEKRARARTQLSAGRGRRAALPTVEQKFHDVIVNDAVVASGGAISTSINLIAQGVTESQRIGRKCTLSGIGWRFDFTLPIQDAVGVPISSDILRIMLIWDKQANGAIPVVTDILETAAYRSFNNLANTSRFRTLCDKVYVLNYKGLASDNAGVVSQTEVHGYGSFYKQLAIPVEFSGATGAITEIRSNNLFILMISRDGIMGFSSSIRLRFTDG